MARSVSYETLSFYLIIHLRQGFRGQFGGQEDVKNNRFRDGDH